MNETNEHTPGPWTAFESADYPHGYEIRIHMGESSIIIAKLEHGPSPLEEQRANARRIVACVNALEGISTEQIEAGGPRLPHVGRGALMAWDELFAQNSRMVEALKRIVNEKPTGYQAGNIARAVLAKHIYHLAD